MDTTGSRGAEPRAGEGDLFFVAPRAGRHPGLVSEVLRSGHSVEFHCSLHIRHTERTRREVEIDTREGLDILRDLGARPRIWRPPWGVLASFSEAVARECGLEMVTWTADTHDWRGDPASQMLGAVAPKVCPGAVVLMHDGLGPGARRSGCAETVTLVGRLVERARALGCEPAPMDPAAVEAAGATIGTAS